MGINTVEKGIEGRSFVMREAKAAWFGGCAFVLGAPCSPVLLGSNQGVDWTTGGNRQRAPELEEELLEVRFKGGGREVGSGHDSISRRRISQKTKIAEKWILHCRRALALLMTADV